VIKDKILEIVRAEFGKHDWDYFSEPVGNVNVRNRRKL
jgi:hypothetical protein